MFHCLSKILFKWQIQLIFISVGVVFKCVGYFQLRLFRFYKLCCFQFFNLGGVKFGQSDPNSRDKLIKSVREVFKREI